MDSGASPDPEALRARQGGCARCTPSRTVGTLRHHGTLNSRLQKGHRIVVPLCPFEDACGLRCSAGLDTIRPAWDARRRRFGSGDGPSTSLRSTVTRAPETAHWRAISRSDQRAHSLSLSSVMTALQVAGRRPSLVHSGSSGGGDGHTNTSVVPVSAALLEQSRVPKRQPNKSPPASIMATGGHDTARSGTGRFLSAPQRRCCGAPLG
jgi:hypothetical protein